MSTKVARSLRRRMSPAEARLWNLLRTAPFEAFHFRRQVPLGPYYADFASHRARLVIEVDGGLHFTDRSAAHDARRTDFMATQGYRVLRFTTIDVLNRLDDAFEAILGALPATEGD